jgi:hypothetical protein
VARALTIIILGLREENDVDAALLEWGSLHVARADYDFAFFVATRY